MITQTNVIIICGFCLVLSNAFDKVHIGFRNIHVHEKQVVGRITGGTEAKKGDFPHQVSLQWGLPPIIAMSHFCGGSIISDQWILTAGHCALAVPSYGLLVVKAGKHLITEFETTEQSIQVTGTFVHEQYKGGVAPYDIALLKLKTKLVLNEFVSAIKLPQSSAIPLGNSILSGWGSISINSTTIMPSKLQNAVLPIISLVTCDNAVKKLTGSSPVHETNVCTGPLSGGFSACSGDSGGPLIKNDSQSIVEVIGIVSWGIIPCGTPGAPSVYTRVSAFVEWIQNKTKSY